jgi:hypothetical protein
MTAAIFRSTVVAWYTVADSSLNARFWSGTFQVATLQIMKKIKVLLPVVHKGTLRECISCSVDRDTLKVLHRYAVLRGIYYTRERLQCILTRVHIQNMSPEGHIRAKINKWNTTS